MKSTMETISFIAAIVLPLWNIPLIYRMVKRRSSADVSLYWVFGVWFCFVAMFPAGIQSPDMVFKAFTIMNFIFFTCVVVTAVFFHKKK